MLILLPPINVGMEGRCTFQVQAPLGVPVMGTQCPHPGNCSKVVPGLRQGGNCAPWAAMAGAEHH